MTMPKEWMTAAEIAATHFHGLPKSKRGINKYAESHGWADGESVRDRKGTGGGREFHISVIPPEAIAAAMDREEERRKALKADEVYRDAHREHERWRPILDRLELRKRLATEGRAALLAEIDALIASGFRTRSRAVNELRERLLDGRASDDLLGFAEAASERTGVPSRTSIYHWLLQRDNFGISGLIPRERDRLNIRHDLFLDSLRHHLEAEIPARRRAEKRVRQCAALLASLTPDERERALDLNASAMRQYAKRKGWRIG
ncbi:MAG TPA: hypothetical protein ENH55_19805 [Aurantimonas coralicida]|uniref:HTH Mu-type domain-containing protein n=2 Tax=root TaxID=1 RepID=A0A9C9NCY3_9HYPH|nr:hypothetical protein [Aurantimonas coralicida]HET99501.1 hypothetical protein [Aurantimonas coralicida]